MSLEIRELKDALEWYATDMGPFSPPIEEWLGDWDRTLSRVDFDCIDPLLQLIREIEVSEVLEFHENPYFQGIRAMLRRIAWSDGQGFLRVAKSVIADPITVLFFCAVVGERLDVYRVMNEIDLEHQFRLYLDEAMERANRTEIRDYIRMYSIP